MYKKFKQVNQDRRRQVIDYVNENYSLANMLVDLGVWDNTVNVIKCPFHPDSRPSFNIDADNNRYKCFSCGSGGKYMSFFYKYHTDVLEENKHFNDYVEDFLNNDNDIQEALGFSTIFITVENVVSLKDLAIYDIKRPTLINVDTRSLAEIRKKVSKESIENLMDFFADVERGTSLQELWVKYYVNNNADTIKIALENKESFMLQFKALLDEVENEDNVDNLDDLDSIPLTDSFGNQSNVTNNQSNVTNNQSNVNNKPDIFGNTFDDLDSIPLMDSFGNITNETKYFK